MVLFAQNISPWTITSNFFRNYEALALGFLKNLDETLLFFSDARHMAHDVDQTLEDLCVEHGKMERQQAVDFLKRLRSRGRYSCDVWS